MTARAGEPATESGRALRSTLTQWSDNGPGDEPAHKRRMRSITKAILAIEQEAADARTAALREAAQAYIDWRDLRLAQWQAVATCGHTDPFCPEMLVIRDTPPDHERKLDDAIRAALAADGAGQEAS